MTTTNNSAEKVCNLEYLRELSNGNEKFVEDMINIFLNEIPDEIKNLEKGIEEKNYDVVRQAAHKLRSTIPFVGLDKIIEKDLLEIEKLAEHQSGQETIKESFARVKDTCQKAYEELR